MTGSSYADPDSSYRPTPWVVPRWLERMVLIITCNVAGLAMVAWAAGLAGQLLLGPVLIFGLAAGYTLYSLWGQVGEPAGTPTHKLGRMVLYVAAASMVFAGVFATGRVLLDGDGAAVTVTAKAAAGSGTPEVTLWVDDANLEMSDGAGAGLVCDEPCQAGTEPAVLRPTESRLVPSLATLPAWVGDDALFRFGALIAGLGLIAFFVMAHMWLRPALALLMMVGVAASPLVSYAARSNHPAIVAFLFASAGLWSLEHGRRSEESGKAIVGGFMCALAGAAFTPALALIGGVMVYLGWREASVAADHWIERRRRRMFAMRVVGGAALPLTIAVVDAAGRGALGAVGTAVWPGVVIGLVLAVGRFVIGRVRGGAPAGIERVVPGVVAGLLLVASVLLIVRPIDVGAASLAVEAAQRAEGIVIDPLRTYVERSPSWLVWYGGPLAVAMAVGGLSLVIAKRRTEWSVPLIIGGFATGRLLFDPGVVGVVPDAALVFLPFGLTALLLPAGLVLESWLSDREWPLMEQVAVVAGIALVVGPVWITVRTWNDEPQPQAVEAVTSLCGLADSEPVMLVGDRNVTMLLAPAVGAFCGVETILDGSVRQALDGSVRIEIGERLDRSDDPVDSSAVLRYSRIRPSVSSPPVARVVDDYPFRVIG